MSIRFPGKAGQEVRPAAVLEPLLAPLLAPSRAPSFRNFGYLPVGQLRYDLPGRLFGSTNLLKRLQARDIMAALAIGAGDAVLDLGCGAGHMTVEMAKLARHAVGIDVNPYVEQIRVPRHLAGHLEFRRVSGIATGFPDCRFDRVLASEVLPMIPQPAEFLAEIRRVIKPEGRLVVVNGTGPQAIADAYRQGSRRLAALRRNHPGRVPPSYEEFVAQFLRIAGTASSRFLDEAEIVAMIEKSGFAVDSVRHSPREVAGAWISWRQFELYLAEGRVVPDGAFLWRFLFLSLLSLFDRRDYRGGLIVAATPRR